ncbi:biotin synthase BioB [Candidatus Poribacteria bacterium]|nr:MAG: biotin synthase BioB [Candidatus Poribacteria bacterium]
MERRFYDELARAGLRGDMLSDELCLDILTSSVVELLPLLDAAYQVRKKYTGKEVQLHIINNAQNGYCPEDCFYCAQAKSSNADIEEYPIKSDAEMLAEAQSAYESGAFRYCMVFAGRGPSKKRVEHLARLIAEIKSRYPIQVCLSAGLIDNEDAQALKAAGLDRLNHNLNTSERHYPRICTTHTYQDRLDTLNAAQTASIELCAGIIVGMGEKERDVIEVAKTLRELGVESIPVNFLIPIPGNALSEAPDLSPEYCLRVLCLYRFLNPKAEIRIAAGREVHLRNMEVMALYPANSLFVDGYLNTRGASRRKTLQMIKDAGFTIKADRALEELLEQEENAQDLLTIDDRKTLLKDIKDLRPQV